jgi:superfamily II DNA or RNA helicase
VLSLRETTTKLFVQGPADELLTVVNDLRFRNPNYYYAISYQKYKASNGKEGWDGYHYPLYPMGATKAVGLRGIKRNVLEAARLNKICVDISGLLESPFKHLQLEDITPDIINAEFGLDEGQRRSILKWLVEGIGINQITVGGGKTATFAGAAAIIKTKYPGARFIYITPAERLVRQVTAAMRKFLPNFEIGQCGGGLAEFEAKDMVVCTVAMLHRNFESLAQQNWFATFKAILYDEVHHAAAPSSKRLLLSIPAFFRFGASDTTKESDPVRHMTLQGLFGPVLNVVESAPLIQIGRLAKPHIYVVDLTQWSNKFDSIPYRAKAGSRAMVWQNGKWLEARYVGPLYETDSKGDIVYREISTAKKDAFGNWIKRKMPVISPGYHRLNISGQIVQADSKWCLLSRAYDKAVIQFKPRNELIVRWAKYFHQQGWPTVVVASRTVHVYILEALLGREIPPERIRVLLGEHTPTERDEVFAWFKSTPGAILITSLVKEGVSINEIRAMIVADHVADYEVARQIIGRAMRPKFQGDNRAHVVWFWDRQHRILSASCRDLFMRLEKMDGFSYYHPCLKPDEVFADMQEHFMFASNKSTES